MTQSQLFEELMSWGNLDWQVLTERFGDAWCEPMDHLIELGLVRAEQHGKVPVFLVNPWACVDAA